MAKAFELHTDQFTVKGETRLGSPMIVFSHGFGVERTSAGLFTDIASILPEDFGYVLFDYPDIADNVWTIHGLNEMKDKLIAVINMAKDSTTNVYIIGHSLGCIVSALSEKNVDKTVFLAPPTRTITGNWKESFVHHRKDRARIDEKGDVHLVRKSDSQEMIIKDEWFSEMVSMPSYAGMVKIAQAGKLIIIEARDDGDIKDRRRYKGLVKEGASLRSLHGNHNFDPPHRAELLKVILTLLQ